MEYVKNNMLTEGAGMRPDSDGVRRVVILISDGEFCGLDIYIYIYIYIYICGRHLDTDVSLTVSPFPFVH